MGRRTGGGIISLLGPMKGGECGWLGVVMALKRRNKQKEERGERRTQPPSFSQLSTTIFAPSFFLDSSASPSTASLNRLTTLSASSLDPWFDPTSASNLSFRLAGDGLSVRSDDGAEGSWRGVKRERKESDLV